MGAGLAAFFGTGKRVRNAARSVRYTKAGGLAEGAGKCDPQQAEGRKTPPQALVVRASIPLRAWKVGGLEAGFLAFAWRAPPMTCGSPLDPA